MTVIPNFILKRMYCNGSLRRIPEGVAFDITNNLGPGQISKINTVKLNDIVYEANRIQLEINGERTPGESISEDNPATFFLNQVIACIILDESLPDGPYKITLDLVSKEAGKVTLTVDDKLHTS